MSESKIKSEKKVQTKRGNHGIIYPTPQPRPSPAKRGKKHQTGRRNRAKTTVNNNKQTTSNWQQNKVNTKQKTKGNYRRQINIPKD